MLVASGEIVSLMKEDGVYKATIYRGLIYNREIKLPDHIKDHDAAETYVREAAKACGYMAMNYAPAIDHLTIVRP